MWATASGVSAPPSNSAGPLSACSGTVPWMNRADRSKRATSRTLPLSRTTREPARSSFRRVIGYRWNQVPFSPPGLRPKRRNCSATYFAVASSPGLGVSRPIIESSAMIPIRWATSAAVMLAAAVPFECAV